MSAVAVVVAAAAAPEIATNKGMKAVGGWVTDHEVEHYSVSADQQRLAAHAALAGNRAFG